MIRQRALGPRFTIAACVAVLALTASAGSAMGDSEPVVLEGHKGKISAVAYSSDGAKLASAGVDGAVRIWEIDGRQTVHSLDGFTGGPVALAWSPDCELLVIGAGDGFIHVWETAKARFRSKFRGHGGKIAALSFAADSKTLATAGDDGRIKLWRVSDEKNFKAIEGNHQVAFLPDGNAIVLQGLSTNLIRICDVATGKQRSAIAGGNWKGPRLAVARDGKWLAAGMQSAGGAIVLWSLPDGVEQFRLEGHERQSVLAVQFSPDGKSLASVGADQSVFLWDLGSGKILEVYQASGGLTSISYAPAGDRVAAGGGDGKVRIWDTTTRIVK